MFLSTDYAHLDDEPQLGFFGNATDANEAGLIVGDLDLGIVNQNQAVYWPSKDVDPELLKNPLFPDLSPGFAHAINGAGQIAGVVLPAPGSLDFIAARWGSIDSFPDFVDPPNGFLKGEALAINEAGDIAGSFVGEENVVEAFMYEFAEGANPTLLGQLPGSVVPFSRANDLNDAGQVVGYGNAGEFLTHAFLWQEGTMYDLNDLVDPIDGVLYLDDAVSITEDGRILAQGMVDDTPGFMKKAIVVLTPEGGCPADINGDGELNILDFVEFQNLFVAGDPAADCDASGELNILDFVCFQGLFQAGCP
jgi:probable HAF family extracellular repeat protein